MPLCSSAPPSSRALCDKTPFPWSYRSRLPSTLFLGSSEQGSEFDLPSVRPVYKLTMSDDGEWGGFDLLKDPRERRHLFSVLDSFRCYRRTAHFNVTHVRRQNFYALPSAYQAYLQGKPISLLDTFCKLDDAIDVNADLADAIERAGALSLGLQMPEVEDPEWAGKATKVDIDKCRSTLNQLYRDWSTEGKVERDVCYGPVLAILKDLLPISAESGLGEGSNRPRVLVPGAGLGRLVYELFSAGYNAEGNELSYHQLLTSSFILNVTTRAHSHRLYPFVHSFSNHLTRASQLQSVTVPDVCPSATPVAPSPDAGSMAMTTGDFVVVYSAQDYAQAFDAVTTVFFIDTAPNLLRYVETVRNCLRTGGLWVNVGPLLWHFESRAPGPNHDTGHEEGDVKEENDGDRGISSPGSFELSHDEVMSLLHDHGFEVLKVQHDIGSTGYIQNPDSMLQNVYRPVHWVARKLAYRKCVDRS